VAAVSRSEDVGWVHDYHLMLLPSMLRAEMPRARIGWFLHTPWPALEVFRTLPMRREIVAGLLGADLLGFHIYEYARHFLHACTHLLGNEVVLEGRTLSLERGIAPHLKSHQAVLGTNERTDPADAADAAAEPLGAPHAVRVDAFPIGIDPGRFERAAESAAVRMRVKQLREQYGAAQARRIRRDIRRDRALMAPDGRCSSGLTALITSRGSRTSCSDSNACSSDTRSTSARWSFYRSVYRRDRT